MFYENTIIDSPRSFFQTTKMMIIFFLLHEISCCGALWNGLVEALLMSIHKICLLGKMRKIATAYEPRHEFSNNVVCATSKASDQPAHTRSLIRAFATCLNILSVLSY